MIGELDRSRALCEKLLSFAAHLALIDAVYQLTEAEQVRAAAPLSGEDVPLGEGRFDRLCLTEPRKVEEILDTGER
jgi:hypothetical protein